MANAITFLMTSLLLHGTLDTMQSALMFDTFLSLFMWGI